MSDFCQFYWGFPNDLTRLASHQFIHSYSLKAACPAVTSQNRLRQKWLSKSKFWDGKPHKNVCLSLLNSLGTINTPQGTEMRAEQNHFNWFLLVFSLYFHCIFNRFQIDGGGGVHDFGRPKL